MIFECKNGHQWDTEARSILKGMWCRYCHGNTREQGENNFKQRVIEKGGLIIGKYTTNQDKVLVQCALGHQWEIFPFNLTNGKWCPVCAYKNHKGGSEKFFQVVANNKGKILGEYINSRTRIKIECDKGHIWDPKPYYVVIGNWCPFCTGSSGENMISLYLRDKNISYNCQCGISDLPRKRFDFIINYKGENIVIEYDGEMHFKYIPYYHITEDYFNYRQSVDKVKTFVALKNNFKVIRIDYSQLMHINHHLDTALNNLIPLYLSNPRLYEGWFSGATISRKEFKSVYDGRSRPDYFDTTNVEEVCINTTSNITHGLSLLVIK